METKKSMHRKALLAIVFAGGILQLHSAALSEDKHGSESSAIQAIVDNVQITPAVRAYDLLRLASAYLEGGDRTATEAQFRTTANIVSRLGNWDNILVRWADDLSVESLDFKDNKGKQPTAAPAARENSVLADAAIKEALSQLDNASDKFAKLNMYLIASRLFQKTGNTDETRKCDEVLQQAFKSCEGKSAVDEKQIEAASSILNSQAYGLVPIQISDTPPDSLLYTESAGLPSFTEKDFKEAEKLKLRAAAMLDRLPKTNHIRRKAHRDLALWYMRVGDTAMAEKEKQILFELVGSHDDRILYPRSAVCGHLVWWEVEKSTGIAGACGPNSNY